MLIAALLLTASPSTLQTSAPPVAPVAKVQAPDLDAFSKEVTRVREAMYAEAKQNDSTTGKTTPRSEIEAKISSVIKEMLKGVEAATIPAKESSEWAQFFQMAGRQTEAEALQTTALGYHSVQMMYSMADLIPSLMSKGKLPEALDLIRRAPDFEASMIGMIGEVVSGALTRNGFDKSKPMYAQECLIALRNRVDLSTRAPGSKRNMADYVYVDLSLKLIELKTRVNPTYSAAAEISALKKKFAKSASTNAFGQSPTFRLDEYSNRQLLLGKAAPELVADRELNGFKGLASLKGKVVLLDFMAHWCGPCKAALPGLVKLQKELGATKFQIISVTSFYGYFGSEQGVSVESEYTKMKKFVKDYEMSWPVVFDAKQSTMAKYAVGPIPHLVVIDQKGMIRKVQVGSTPEGEKELGKFIRDLVGRAS